MEGMLTNGNFLLQQVEAFNTLYRGFASAGQLNQFTQLSMLHAANQLVVPEATPVPGYERIALPQMTSQDITSAFEIPQRRSYLDDLMRDGPETVEELFNGTPPISPFDQNDIDQLPDLTVFDQLPEDELSSERFPTNLTVLQSVKEEVRSPVSCDSQSVYSYLSASPPHSPAFSEVSSHAYSTDEGIQSDFSDVEEFLENISSVGSPQSVNDESELKQLKELLPVKKEPTDVTPTKTQRKKRGPKPPAKYRGDGPIQLWQFLLELIIDPVCSNLIKWTQDEDFEFKILQPSTVAKMWGKKKNKPTMNYEKLSRGLRYYYGKKVIEKVHGKRYVYQFMCDIPKILSYNPMVKCEDESCVEDSVCGEPVMSPEVEDLLVSSSVEDGYLAGSLDFSALCNY